MSESSHSNSFVVASIKSKECELTRDVWKRGSLTTLRIPGKLWRKNGLNVR